MREAGETVGIQGVWKRRLPWWVEVLVRLVRTKPLGLAGAVILLLMVMAAIFADLIAPYGYAQIIPADRFAGYSKAHWLGADQLGRDLFTRIVYGARISLSIGFAAVLIASVVSLLIGVPSAYFGGRTDIFLQRLVDAWMAFPGLLILLTVLSLTGPGLVQITIVLGVSSGIANSRVVRGVALSIKENQYIEAARALGASPLRIMLAHMVPNTMATVIVLATIGLGTVILTEASLSFLGYGVPPPTPTWGGMLSLEGLRYMYDAPWMAIWPGVALSLAVFAFNMFGDALRDLLDPRLRGAG
ncbi:Glutathione transport system permease protein GsiD [bacterium HR23]|nr:Glutathione transport system permease protein GsiD [bacterium HR23]